MTVGSAVPGRAALETDWLHLTRVTLPALAASRGWPIRNDHCFQRVLLDAACGGRWLDHVTGRPAYKMIDDDRLATAVSLAQAVASRSADLAALNRQSLRWRGKRPTDAIPCGA